MPTQVQVPRAEAGLGRPGRKAKPLRFLDLNFEGHDITFKNSDMDNGKLPHGGYKGIKRHPPGLHHWERGKDYQGQLEHDLARLMEADVLAVQGSPSWTLDAHRQQTHSGESALLTNAFLSPSKHEAVNGSGRHAGSERRRASAPPCPSGTRYYRPSRMHQYLTATTLAQDAVTQDDLKYGRPTRTTLLRARQRAGHPSNSIKHRRMKEQRVEELKTTNMLNIPKDYCVIQPEVDGEKLYPFLTGARYNRAHLLDAKSLTQFGVYMPRSNPLGCFVLRQERDPDQVTPAESPRSEREPRVGTARATPRQRPLTAPNLGRRPVSHVQHAGHTTPSPRHAWGDASAAVHVQPGEGERLGGWGEGGASPRHRGDTGGDTGDKGEEKPRCWSARFGVKGRSVSLAGNREGPVRFESKLPSVKGIILSPRHRMQREAGDETSEANQPPPSLVDSRADQQAAKAQPEPEVQVDPEAQEAPEAEAEADEAEHAQTLPAGNHPVTVPSVSGDGEADVAEDEEAEEEEQATKEEEDMVEVAEDENQEEIQAEGGEHLQDGEKVEEGTKVETGQAEGQSITEKVEKETPERHEAEDVPTSHEATVDETPEDTATGGVQEKEKEVDEQPSQENGGTQDDGDDAKFFLTEGQKLDAPVTGGVEETEEEVPPQDTEVTAAGAVEPAEGVGGDVEGGEENEGAGTYRSRESDDAAQDASQAPAEEPLKVIVTHIEQKLGAPVTEGSGEAKVRKGH